MDQLGYVLGIFCVVFSCIAILGMFGMAIQRVIDDIRERGNK